MKKRTLLFLMLTGTLVHAQVLKRRSFEEDGKLYVYEYAINPELHSKYIRTMRHDGDTTILELAMLSNMNPDLFEGVFTRYGDDGKVLEKGEYVKHRKTGSWMYYFRKGEIRERLNYKIDSDLDVEFLIEEVFDSLGNAVVKNGNGSYTEYIGLDSLKNTTDVMSGPVVNGYKHGVWDGAILKFKDKYQEEWDMGRLLSGLRVDSLGNEIKYTKITVGAEPRGGLTTFYQHVGRNIKYPGSARRQGIEGRVFVEFIVEKDGTTSGVKVVKGIGRECDEEAVRVVKSFKLWNPGVVRGRTVRQKMVIPLVFKLR